MVRFDVEDAGTAESTWARWLASAPWPVLDVGAAGHPLVVAPHPDDEVLGAGGLIATVPAVDILAVTDGEASHPDVADLAARRRDETTAALTLLGASATARVERLGQPDGGVDEPALTRELSARLTPGRWCVAPWRGDGHPDHEAVGRAAAAACARTGARLLEFPVWAWHWSAPDDARVPWARAHRLPLPAAVVAAKTAAIGAFRTQVEPVAGVTILPRHVIDRFHRPYEVYFA